MNPTKLKMPPPAALGGLETGTSKSGAPDGPPALCIENLCVGYKKSFFSPFNRVVHDLNLSVRPGEVVGFLGPNGAGKSSTIKSIMGFVVPEVGSVTIFGHPAGSTLAKAKIGYLPEVALYYPFLTPMETLTLYGRLQGLGGSALQDEARELLERVGLKGKEKLQLKTFSKGNAAAARHRAGAAGKPGSSGAR
jgi:ABC-2 type transport system ATP-binding protein